MQFVPIPADLEALNKTSSHWLPFLPKISRRSKEPVQHLLQQIHDFEVQLAVMWDEDTNAAQALLGIHYARRGDELIGEIVWLTGIGMRRWLHLLPVVERFLRDRGCAEMRPICRPGWARMLKGQGFKITHYCLEKRL